MDYPAFRTVHAADIAWMACAELCRGVKFPLQKPDVLYGGAHIPQVHRLARQGWFFSRVSFVRHRTEVVGGKV